MINPNQYVKYVLEPTLRKLGMYSIDAMHLMFRTALVESKLTHIRQLPDGPALSFLQIEPASYHDVMRYLERRGAIKADVLRVIESDRLPSNSLRLAQDLALCVAVARIKYWMEPTPIPSYKDVEAQAEYWKRYYNTTEGKGCVEDFVKQASASLEYISDE